MASLNTPLCDFGWKAIDFNLEGVDGTYWNLEKAKGPYGLVVMFICNHCPYVKAILPRLAKDIRALKNLGIETIAIQSNDSVNYPEDSFENMKLIADQFDFSRVQNVSSTPCKLKSMAFQPKSQSGVFKLTMFYALI
jgi:hypothetical protein